MEMQKPRYRAGDLVQFEYDSGIKNGKWKRIVCVEQPLFEDNGWHGYYRGYLFWDESGNEHDYHKYKLEDLEGMPTSIGRKLIARIGE